MEYKIASRMEKLVPSGIRKVNEKTLAMERAGERVYHFEIGRPDFDTPRYIKDACVSALEAGQVHYTSNFGLMDLRKAVAEKLERVNHVPYRAEEVLITAGLSEAVFDVLCTLLDEGDEILVPDPVWMNYQTVPALLNAVPVTYSLLEENDYQLDLNEIRGKITSRTKAIVIVSPNNPTGGILGRKALEELAAIAKETDLLVVSDEVYERFIFADGEHISIASLPGMKERTITMNGFSKAYSMTGWRLGYIAAPEELIKTINKIHHYVSVCANSFSQWAAISALRNETNEVADMVKEFSRRRDYAVGKVNSIPGISCLPPKGSFYIFINVKSLGMSSADIAAYLLEHQKIALVPGDVFGVNGEGYLRMSFATAYDDIVEGCRRLEQGIKELITAKG